MDDHDFASFAAEAVGIRLLQVRAQFTGSDPAGLGAVGDREAQTLIARLLREHRPDDAVLSEETPDDPARLDADRVWIIDPLDGTREFADPPRDDWAVQVALWEKDRLTAGAVALPARALVLSTGQHPPTPPAWAGPPRMLVSRTRPPPFAGRLADLLGVQVLPQGSAGAKTADVLLGAADLYVHAGGQHEWDSAGPVAVAQAWGFHTSRLDGSPLVYNRPDPMLPDLIVSRTDLAPRVLAACARISHP
ncbi:3'(2'),5'-bisphosphate nucleotidase CysQ [Streptomyces sp. NL15-2K]|uniref:3'(2'),5'-bisphosphate nucleotidase CysQ n=1 Tax=Streptomyces sp. NL15-2K TaxID=376149 RepID=UPI000F56E7B9|nr:MULTISPECIES: 3'(2'),5'-bisphosphate nucleotidase CysQ [Actinomycetes]WKX14013.1 3'(2'),5'-bisphosphate nucleotidase CysQ [Kutzneria buriramensis]GCB50789.1 3'-phosphoadenoside 5'-phosphosulfate metabolism [Streptomyces sp. NL15-2K]